MCVLTVEGLENAVRVCELNSRNAITISNFPRVAYDNKWLEVIRNWLTLLFTMMWSSTHVRLLLNTCDISNTLA